MVRQFLRISKMNDTRLTKKIVKWDENFSEQHNLPTWFSEVKTIFHDHNLMAFFNINHDFKNDQFIAEKLKESLLIKQSFDLKNRCLEKPKLRTFNSFKDFGSTPSYITMPLTFIQRKFLAQFRLSSLPIRLETGRYERPRLPEQARLCQVCSDGVSIENEEHFAFFCASYHNIRQVWLAKMKVPLNFIQLPIPEKLKITCNEPENVRLTAQFIIDAYNIRSKLIFNHVNPV